MEEYCPLCVDYFIDIKEHNFIKHDKKIIGFNSKDGQTTTKYSLPFLERLRDCIKMKVENIVQQKGDSV